MVSWWAEQLGRLGVGVALSRGILWRAEKGALDTELRPREGVGSGPEKTRKAERCLDHICVCSRRNEEPSDSGTPGLAKVWGLTGAGVEAELDTKES